VQGRLLLQRPLEDDFEAGRIERLLDEVEDASMVPLPVMMTTGVSGCSSRSARTSASPSSFGITRSLMITSGCISAAIFRAAWPSAV